MQNRLDLNGMKKDITQISCATSVRQNHFKVLSLENMIFNYKRRVKMKHELGMMNVSTAPKYYEVMLKPET